MEALIENLHEIFGSIIKISYQASILICLIMLLQLLFRKKYSPRWHYWLWLLLLLRMIIPWTPESSVSLFSLIPDISNKTLTTEATAIGHQPLISYDSSNDSNYTSHTTTRPETTSLPSPLTDTEGSGFRTNFFFSSIDVLPLAWLVGVFIFGIYVFTSNFRLWRIIKCHRPLTQQKILDLLEDCKSRMDIQTVVAVVVTDKIKSPALFGFLRPRLLLPKGLIDDFSYDQLRYIFLHELAHLKRHDILIGWIMAVLQTLHWFNPVIYFAFGRIRSDRELACDGLTLSRMNVDEPKLYGGTIVSLLEKFSQPQILPAVAGILENKSQMKRRITMIAQFKKSTYYPSIWAVILILVFGFSVLTSPEAKSEVPQTNGDSKVMAGEFVELLLEQDFEAAREKFDGKLQDTMSQSQLEQTWSGIVEQAGAFVKQLGVRKQKFLATDIVFVTCEFENGPLDVKVVYDANGNITSLSFVPTPEAILEEYKKEPQAVATSASTIGPLVLETSPSVFATDVESGYQKISVTFDRAMMNRSWSWVGGGEMFPEIKGNPSYDFARRKCTITTKLDPGKVYRIGINSPSFKNFQTPDHIPAVSYVILFATKDQNGNPTPIPEDLINETKQINSVTDTARTASARTGKASSGGGEITLSHDDETSAGRESIAGSGHGVQFETSVPSTLTAVRLYGSRYGHPQPPREDFHVMLCDENFKVIEDFAFPYSIFKKGNPKWTTLKVKPTEVSSKFFIFVNFNPEQTKGVYVHYDKEASGNSYIGLPNQQLRSFERGDWMIQAVVEQQQKADALSDLSQATQPTLKTETRKNYLGQTNFPEIVKLEPENHAVNVDPNLEYITVTYDRPMRGGYSWVDKGNCPQIEKIEWIDEYSCRAWVKLEPNTNYGVWLNFGPNTCKFKSKEMVSADRTLWQFRTASE